MKPAIRALCVLAAIGLISVAVAVPALASSRPVVTGLSRHHGTYWGGARITVYGHNFTHVQKVLFGGKRGYSVHVISSTRLTVYDPEHRYGRNHVRVVTTAGTSTGTTADWFTFTHPTMNTPIQGGLTARQEISISAHVRATHKGVWTAPRSRAWTPAMGMTALKRARSWLGLPYSWAGGSTRGPTYGVCAHNGGDLDCHIVGFDCSGLTMYAWAPYKTMAHYAATQYRQAGRFHPTTGELMPGDLVFFSGYIANGIGHVAIYEGNGMVIQAEQSGTRVMRSRLADVIAASGRYRGATRPTSTGQQGPGPRLSTITPVVTVNGGYIAITGSQLGTATSMSIGGQMIYSFASRTASRLVVKAPPHTAGKVSVLVSNAWGNARTTLTYAGPTISTMAPATALTTATSTPVTITGKYLNTVTKVTVGAASVRFAHSGTTGLTLTMPPSATAGTVWVRIYSRFGWAGSRPFSYTVPAPPSSSSQPASPATPRSSSTPQPTTSTPPPTSSAPPSTSSPPPTSTSPPSSPVSSPSTTSASSSPSEPGP